MEPIRSDHTTVDLGRRGRLVVVQTINLHAAADNDGKVTIADLNQHTTCTVELRTAKGEKNLQRNVSLDRALGFVTGYGAAIESRKKSKATKPADGADEAKAKSGRRGGRKPAEESAS